MTETQSLKRQVFNASKWSVLSELASKAITPLIFVVLARLLTPEDFGVAASAAIIISFSQVFWDAGLSKALIQREGDVEAAANVVFWTNAGFSLVIYVLLFILADGVALLFKDPRVASVVRVQGVQILLASLGSVHTALYHRDFNFKSLFWVRLLTSTFPSLASVPLAWMGFSYWALVAGTLTGAVVQVAVLWFLSPWRPKLEYNLSLASQLLSFGLWVTGGGLLGWFYLWVDSLIVGAFLDINSLGLYRTGNALVLMVFGFLLNPITPVLYSALSRIRNDSALFRESLLQATKVISMIALPAGLGLFLVRDSLAEVVFGNDWPGVREVIGVMALMRGVSWVVGANSEAYRAMGRPDLETKIMLYMLLVYLPVYLLTISLGLEVFIWVRFGLAGLALLVHLYIGSQFLNIKLCDLIMRLRCIVPLSGLMGFFAYALSAYLDHNLGSLMALTLIIPCSVFIYCSTLFLFERQFVKNLYVSFRGIG